MFNKFIKPKYKLPWFLNDIDRDGVPNYRDCRPWNPHKQHLSKSEKERLSKLRFYVAKERGPVGKYPDVPVTSREAKKYAPKARAQIYGAIHRYPHILNDLERLKQENHEAYISHTSDESRKPYEYQIPSDALGSTDIENRLVYTAGSHPILPLPHVLTHEIRHVMQSRGKNIFDVRQEAMTYEYSDRPLEIDAEKYTKEQLEKRKRKGEKLPAESYKVF